MERWQGRVALVTGDSSGIGSQVRDTLLRHGMKVVGCARRKQEDIGSQYFSYQLDLNDTEAIAEMFKWIENHPQLGGVDVCVCNAGTVFSNSLLEADVDEWRQMLSVNVLASAMCAQLSIAGMLRRRVLDGHVVFVNSMSGHSVHPYPITRFYSATKYAVTALVDGWRQEVRDVGDNNIRVSAISPRLVETEFAFRLFPSDPEKANAIYSSVSCLQPQDVADSVVYALSAPEHVQVLDVWLSPTHRKY
jgi:NADP-dependent 3-hydroxy acid dehydrogenase YdfG